MSFSIPLSITFKKKYHVFLNLYFILASTLKLDKFLRRLGRDVLRDRDNIPTPHNLAYTSPVHLFNVNCFSVLA